MVLRHALCTNTFFNMTCVTMLRPLLIVSIPLLTTFRPLSVSVSVSSKGGIAMTLTVEGRGADAHDGTCATSAPIKLGGSPSTLVDRLWTYTRH